MDEVAGGLAPDSGVQPLAVMTWTAENGYLPDGGCIVRSGVTYIITTREALDRLPSCHFEGGSAMSFPTSEGQDEQQAVEATRKPPTARSSPVKTEKPVEKSAPAAAVEEARAEAAEVAAKAQAIVEQPVAAVADLKNAIPADANIFTVLMGVVAVAGGGAAWKFYSDHSKRKHEQEMTRIEKQDSQPGECKGHGLMKAELSSVASKVDAVAAKVDALEKRAEEQRLTMGDWDASDMTERVEKLEKKVKKLKKERDEEE